VGGVGGYYTNLSLDGLRVYTTYFLLLEFRLTDGSILGTRNGVTNDRTEIGFTIAIEIVPQVGDGRPPVLLDEGHVSGESRAVFVVKIPEIEGLRLGNLHTEGEMIETTRRGQ